MNRKDNMLIKFSVILSVHSSVMSQ